MDCIGCFWGSFYIGMLGKCLSKFGLYWLLNEKFKFWVVYNESLFLLWNIMEWLLMLLFVEFLLLGIGFLLEGRLFL